MELILFDINGSHLARKRKRVDRSRKVQLRYVEVLNAWWHPAEVNGSTVLDWAVLTKEVPSMVWVPIDGKDVTVGGTLDTAPCAGLQKNALFVSKTRSIIKISYEDLH